MYEGIEDTRIDLPTMMRQILICFEPQHSKDKRCDLLCNIPQLREGQSITKPENYLIIAALKGVKKGDDNSKELYETMHKVFTEVLSNRGINL